MAKIYISYNHKDTEVATRISSGLKELGHELVLDVEMLTAGEEWRSTLNEALQSSEVFLSLLTVNSINSQYVLTELGAARAFKQTSKQMLVIPILLDEIGIPAVIRDIQALYSPERDIPKIVKDVDRAITAYIGKRAAEKQQEVEVKRRIESNAATYIDEAVSSLSNHEMLNRRRGNFWYYLGYGTLVAGVVFGAFGIAKIAQLQEGQWIHFAGIALKSVVVIGLLIACSKYSFTLGKSYMSEALKSADRIHAIAFGKFYLRVFSDKADWLELKEVFQHWNIDAGSPFSNLDVSNFDPKFLESLIELIKIAASKVK